MLIATCPLLADERKVLATCFLRLVCKLLVINIVVLVEIQVAYKMYTCLLNEAYNTEMRRVRRHLME